jgi:tetratricopeptide (TPR) repeat protein
VDQSGGEPQYFRIRASAFASNLEYDKALEDIHYFLSFYPNEIDAMAKFAEYSMESGKLINALLQLGKLIKLDSTEPTYFNMRGKIYMKSSNWAMAEIDLNQAIKLNPNNADAFLNRGICRYNQGETSSACSDWREAIKLGSFKAQEFVYKNCR